ncbi:TPA: FaeA/PapI family transcriptional regulator [Escherichia coli]
MKLEAEGKIKRSPPRRGGHTSWAIVCQADKQG